MHRVAVDRLFPHPIEAVFRRYTDHPGWTDWAGLGRVRLVRDGTPDRNGLGAVRAFSASPGLREEVTLFDPPHRMDYRIVQGAYPLTDHHGEVLFAPEGTGTRVTWSVTFRSKLPLLGWPIKGGLTLLFRKILGGLARDLDGRLGKAA
jgi:uncharacterized protein YndB with AHSA1/START domain